ncbi:hypothetical protein JHK85_023343 [Glycine max]|nr:hypothetical protein JHK85_023343 [Glycine max]KAG5026963.1 hypothetical protein JHK86_022877 [Glycine max]
MESAFSKADTVSNANVVWHQAANEPTFRCPDELGWQPQTPKYKYSSRIRTEHSRCIVL